MTHPSLSHRPNESDRLRICCVVSTTVVGTGPRPCLYQAIAPLTSHERMPRLFSSVNSRDLSVRSSFPLFELGNEITRIRVSQNAASSGGALGG